MLHGAWRRKRKSKINAWALAVGLGLDPGIHPARAGADVVPRACGGGAPTQAYGYPAYQVMYA